MLRKEKAAGGKVKVTFSMPALEGVTALYLVGSFNDWSDTATPLVLGADGGWSAALTLDDGLGLPVPVPGPGRRVAQRLGR